MNRISDPGIGRINLVPWAVAVTLAFTALRPLSAQDSCEEALRQAEKRYAVGLFDDVPEQLAPCLAASVSRVLAVQVHYLLARTYVATDETARALEEVATLLRLDGSFEPASPPPRFAALLDRVRREEATVQVASVSKTKESLREAPATVVVVRAEEIERRGYLDLEQLLHDLPGFEVSRTKGDIYTSVYQRGFYSHFSDRTLFLVDGVEQNDLTSNTLLLARQYPLNTLDRIEIVYGPSSTMYGANAYSGVINVFTKDPEALLATGRRSGASVQVTSGGFSTRVADVALPGRDGTGNLAWSLSGHLHRGHDLDLSDREDWDFKYDSIGYRDRLRLTGKAAIDFQAAHSCAPGSSPYYRCLFDGQSRLASIELTEEGERLARDLDRRFIRDAGIRFDDRTDDWSLHGKLRIAALILGIDVARSDEGFGSSYNDLFTDGRSGSATRDTSLYLKYSRPVGRDLTFHSFTRYHQTGYDRLGTDLRVLHLYASGELGISNLVAPCRGPNDPIEPIGCPASPWFDRRVFGSFSSQVRSEFSLVYQPAGRLSGVAGLELVKGSISQQDQEAIGPDGVPFLVVPEVQVEHSDVGFYAQGSYRLRQDLKAVLSGRLSYNEINNRRSASGFGLLFTPRAALIYTPGHLTFKAIYSEAFKDPPDFQKFGILPPVFTVPSGGLRPERVKNVELTAGWQPTEGGSVEAAIYEARYTGIVALRPIPGCSTPSGCAKLENHDEFRIRGLQATARYRRGGLELWGSYTYVDPVQTNPDDGAGGPLLDGEGRRIGELRIGEIARHHVNLGVDAALGGGLRLDLLGRYVGVRPTGQGTTVAGNPLSEVGSYTVADATLSYRTPVPGTTLQLIVYNLFDRAYFDPGRDADSIGVARVPQDGRTLFLRVSFSPERLREPGAKSGEKEGGV